MKMRWCSLFDKKNLYFDGATREDFASFLWWKSQRAFVVYRLFIVIFSTSWLVAHLEQNYRMGLLVEFMLYLTHWVEAILSIYAVTFLGVAIVELRRTVKEAELHVDIFPSEEPTTESPSATKVIEDSLSVAEGDSSLRWYHKACWYFYELSFVGSLLISIIYWSSSFKESNLQENPFDIYQHGLNFVIMISDCFVTRLPVRALHAVQQSAFFLAYMLFSLIVNVARNASMEADEVMPIYSILDWINKPLYPVIFTVLIFPVNLIAQLALVGLHKIRSYAHVKWTRENRPIGS